MSPSRKKRLPPAGNLYRLVRAAEVQPVPADWLTVEELARREGFSSDRPAYDMIRRALKLGFLERRNFRVFWGRCIRQRPYYRYTSPAK